MQISVREIGVEDRIRRRVERVPELAVSLQTHGQIHSITVRKPTIEEKEQHDKPWMLVTGGRRLAAAILSGWETIRGEELEDLSPYQRKAIELEENIQREDMHFADIVAAKEQLHELYKAEAKGEGKDWRIEDTAKAIGESVANLSRDLQLAADVKANPELRKASSKKAAVTHMKMSRHADATNFQNAERGKFVQILKRDIVIADARDWLRTKDTGHFDLFLTDFPYGIDYFEMPAENQQNDISKFDDSRDAAQDLITDAIPQIVRVTAETGWMVFFAGWEGYFFVRDCLANVCCTHGEYFLEIDGPREYCPVGGKNSKGKSGCKHLSLPPKPWIWFRPNSRNNSMQPDTNAKNMYEPFLVINRGKGKLASIEASQKGNVLVYDAEYEDRVHVHQKPVPLGADIIERFTQFDQRVGDCCMGSGAFPAAAAKTSRAFEACDLNPLMLNVALGKIAMEYKGE